MPSWDLLCGGVLPPDEDGDEAGPDEDRRGWQGRASKGNEERRALGLFQHPAGASLPPAPVFVKASRVVGARERAAAKRVPRRHGAQAAIVQEPRGLAGPADQGARITWLRGLLAQGGNQLGGEMRIPARQDRETVSQTRPKSGGASPSTAAEAAPAHRQWESGLSLWLHPGKDPRAR